MPMQAKKEKNKRVIQDDTLEEYKVDLQRKGYSFIGYLGTGNWGEVYQFRKDSINCHRAVKILLPKYKDNKNVKDRFISEAEKLSKLSHNHIVNIFDFGSLALPYLVMEYVDSDNLANFLKANSNLKRNDYLEILNQICDVLKYIHSNKIVHFDVKEENILIEKPLSAKGIKLADFGVAHYILGSPSDKYEFDPDQYRIPPSLESKRGEYLSRSDIKPIHDLWFLGNMLRRIHYENYVMEKFSPRQVQILKKLINNLCQERINIAEELEAKLLKLAPTYPLSGGIPELAAAQAVDSETSIRIPPQIIVPTTKRLLKLIDLPEIQRLRRVKQLGPTSLIYPGGIHTRFEHSLGAYSTAVEYLLYLLGDPEFDYLFSSQELTAVLISALLHDIGHYPFSHQLEELSDIRIPIHSRIAEQLISKKLCLPNRGRDLPTIYDVICNDFDVDPKLVIRLITNKPENKNEKILASFFDGGIDVDKQDYLFRDAHHLGVEYSKHIDKIRLLRSLTISKEKDQLAVTEKGKVAAEFTIMGRSAMFSEVYWHHTNRAATAMIQRAFKEFIKYEKPRKNELLMKLLAKDDMEVMAFLINKGSSMVKDLIPSPPPWSLRKIYKRVVTFAFHYGGYKKDIYDKLISYDKKRIEEVEKKIYKKLHKKYSELKVEPHEILLDIPSGKEKLSPIQIVYPNTPNRIEISIEKITHFKDSIFEDFFKHAKKARLFCHPRLKSTFEKDEGDIRRIIAEIIDVPLPKDYENSNSF